MVTSIGHNTEASWKNLLQYKSGVRSCINNPGIYNKKSYSTAFIQGL
jgi:hypothetical protein